MLQVLDGQLFSMMLRMAEGVVWRAGGVWGDKAMEFHLFFPLFLFLIILKFLSYNNILILQNVERVIFVGNYLCGNKMSMQMLAYAMDYWSTNTVKALFLEHEGYFGALGSMLFHLDPDCSQ